MKKFGSLEERDSHSKRERGRERKNSRYYEEKEAVRERDREEH